MQMPSKNDPTVSFRIDKQDKDRIKQLAKKCGLSQTEYIKQRALGYEPRAIPPDVLFILLEKIGELENKSSSEELNDEIRNLLREISNELLLPGKEPM
jgi:antitoxin component of RelBE/YafQ-DinJ toxin-antitoxin module